MSPVELITLSLGLSIAVAAIGGLAAAGLERLSGDATLRDRAWAAALYLPALPPLAVALMLLIPAPVVTVAEVSARTVVAPLLEIAPAVAPVAPGFSLEGGLVALVVLTLAGLLIAARLSSLTRRAARLRRLLVCTGPVSPEATHAVAAVARSLRIAARAVRATPTGADALLAGLIRPVLILPAALTQTPDAPAARAVITHELAHLKRGDHRAVWIEEALIAALAVNPLLPLIRARRAAAREEACDALALTGADPAARRAYAHSLIEALRARAATSPLPALTFTGTQRSQAMRRLKSILTPPATAGQGTRVLALAAGFTLLIAAGFATAAVASHRQAETASVTQDDADATAKAASHQAVAAASANLTPEQRARLSNPSVADYRRICASGDPGGGGFCAGVIFRHLGDSGVCAPPAIDDKNVKISGPALSALVERAKAQFETIPESAAQSPHQLTLAALRRAYPCQTDSTAPQRIDLGTEPRFLINGAPVSSDLPIWGLSANAIDVQTAEAPGGASVAFTLPTSRTPPVFIDDVRLPDGVGLSALRPEMIESRRTMADGSIRVKLKPRPLPPTPMSASGQATGQRAAAIASAQAGGTAPVAGTTRLTIKIGQDTTPFVIGRGFILSVSMTGENNGVRTVTSTEMPLGPDSAIGRLVFFDLDSKAFPARMPGYAYALKAEIKDSQGRVFYASDASTLRLAPMSQGQLATLRPELVLKRTALAPS